VDPSQIEALSSGQLLLRSSGRFQPGQRHRSFQADLPGGEESLQLGTVGVGEEEQIAGLAMRKIEARSNPINHRPATIGQPHLRRIHLTKRLQLVSPQHPMGGVGGEQILFHLIDRTNRQLHTYEYEDQV
jgi:hypothetical protein